MRGRRSPPPESRVGEGRGQGTDRKAGTGRNRRGVARGRGEGRGVQRGRQVGDKGERAREGEGARGGGAESGVSGRGLRAAGALRGGPAVLAKGARRRARAHLYFAAGSSSPAWRWPSAGASSGHRGLVDWPPGTQARCPLLSRAGSGTDAPGAAPSGARGWGGGRAPGHRL